MRAAVLRLYGKVGNGKTNGRNTKQGLVDAAELGKHFDTAIDAMTMLLAGFKEESEAQNEE